MFDSRRFIIIWKPSTISVRLDFHFLQKRKSVQKVCLDFLVTVQKVMTAQICFEEKWKFGHTLENLDGQLEIVEGFCLW